MGDGGEVGEGVERWDIGYPNRPGILRAIPLATWLSQPSSYYGLLVHWSTLDQRKSLHSVTVGKA